MKGYVANIEEETLANDYFRRVLYTDERMQLVVMTLKPGEDIGMEVHHLDQLIRVEAGEGEAVLDSEAHAIGNGSIIIVPAGTNHNIVNISKDQPMKLYTLYAPPDHRPGTVHKTKADALADKEDEFKGVA